MDLFYKDFKQEEKVLRETIETLSVGNFTNEEEPRKLDECFTQLSHLSDRVKDVSSTLPVHDQQSYALAIKNLTESLQALRNASAPKRKFALKKPIISSRGTASGSNNASRTAETSLQRHLVEAAGGDDMPAPARDTERSGFRASYLVPGKYTLQIGPEDLDLLYSSVTLSVLRGCVVDLSLTLAVTGAFPGLTITEAYGSLLICGIISGATHVTGMKSSTLIITSRQLRMHKCDDCVIYLSCGSRPIIEDCQNMRFAPLPSPAKQWASSIQSPSSAGRFKDTILAEEGFPNLWDQVDDFNWLKDSHSPNWRILTEEEAEHLRSDDLIELMAGKATHHTLKDLLLMAKIKGGDNE